MAVGKGSMARASRAAAKAAPADAEVKTQKENKEAVQAKAADEIKAASGIKDAQGAGEETAKKTTETKKASGAKRGTGTKKAAKKTATAHVVAAPSPEVLDKIIYQESSQVLNRDAEPNERFGVGESMPIYFF